jgi:magnesium-transporting ATPase (P-type)
VHCGCGVLYVRVLAAVPSIPVQIMHRFHFSSGLKRMSTIVEAEGGGPSRWVLA